MNAWACTALSALPYPRNRPRSEAVQPLHRHTWRVFPIPHRRRDPSCIAGCRLQIQSALPARYTGAVCAVAQWCWPPSTGAAGCAAQSDPRLVAIRKMGTATTPALLLPDQSSAPVRVFVQSCLFLPHQNGISSSSYPGGLLRCPAAGIIDCWRGWDWCW